MTEECVYLKAVVFDWAGTTIDHGSCAPAAVFHQIFHRRGIEITVEQARGPMGMPKRDHIAAIGALESVASAWMTKYHRPFGEEDVDAMYQDFLPLQNATLADHGKLIPGAAEAIRSCREMGLKIGSTTGYTRALMEVVTELARHQGYEPDCVLCAEDAPRGRPAPYLLYEAAKRLDVFPMWKIVKVDDTTIGIEAGRNAGCWTIGITLTGNLVGMSEEAVARFPAEKLRSRCEDADRRLREAGAHFTAESVAEIPRLLRIIDHRASCGELPIIASGKQAQV